MIVLKFGILVICIFSILYSSILQFIFQYCFSNIVLNKYDSTLQMNSITSKVSFVSSVRKYKLQRLQENKAYVLFTTTKSQGVN